MKLTSAGALTWVMYRNNNTEHLKYVLFWQIWPNGDTTKHNYYLYKIYNILLSLETKHKVSLSRFLKKNYTLAT